MQYYVTGVSHAANATQRFIFISRGHDRPDLGLKLYLATAKHCW